MRFYTLFVVLLTEPDRTNRRRLLVIGPPGATVDHVRAHLRDWFAPREGSESEAAHAPGEAASPAENAGAAIVTATVSSEGE